MAQDCYFRDPDAPPGFRYSCYYLNISNVSFDGDNVTVTVTLRRESDGAIIEDGLLELIIDGEVVDSISGLDVPGLETDHTLSGPASEGDNFVIAFESESAWPISTSTNGTVPEGPELSDFMVDGSFNVVSEESNTISAWLDIENDIDRSIQISAWLTVDGEDILFEETNVSPGSSSRMFGKERSVEVDVPVGEEDTFNVCITPEEVSIE